MIYSVDVTVRVPVRPTEVTERVVDCVEHLFPGATIEERPRQPEEKETDRNRTSGGEIVAETHSLEHLSELFHEQTILDTARAALLNGLDGEQDDSFEFRLKKQAAFEGVVNFSVGKPSELGDIHVSVTVNDPDPESYIQYIAPPTEDGVPVETDNER